MENQSYTFSEAVNSGKESEDSMSSQKSNTNNNDDDDTDTLKLADEQEAIPLAVLDVCI